MKGSVLDEGSSEEIRPEVAIIKNRPLTVWCFWLEDLGVALGVRIALTCAGRSSTTDQRKQASIRFTNRFGGNK